MACSGSKLLGLLIIVCMASVETHVIGYYNMYKDKDCTRALCPTPNGKFADIADITDCTRYIQCTNEQANWVNCPSGLHFSRTQGTCLQPELAGCQERGKAVVQEYSWNKTLVQPFTFVFDPKGHRFPHHTVWDCIHWRFLHIYKCYLTIGTRKTYADAVKYCEESGFKLVDIYSKAENDYVTSIKGNCITWIVGSLSKVKAQILNSSGDVSSKPWENLYYIPRSFRPYELMNRSCFFTSPTDPTWHSWYCETRFPFICEAAYSDAWQGWRWPNITTPVRRRYQYMFGKWYDSGPWAKDPYPGAK